MKSHRPPLPAGFLVAAMYVAYFLNFCDRQVVFSIYPLLKSELGFHDAQLGLIGTVFGIVYGVCSPIAGQIADKFSQVALVVLSLMFWSLLTVLTGFSNSIVMLLCCRALIGVSESLYMPAAISLTGSAYPAAARSRAIGTLKTAQIFGVILGGWFGGAMADAGHWRGAFFVLGAIGVVYVIPYRVCLKRCASSRAVETRNSGSFLAIASLIRIPSYLLLGVIFGVYSFGLWLVYSWLPTFFHEKFSLGLGDSAFAATAYLQGAALVTMLAGAWLADRLSQNRPAARFVVIGLGLLLSVPCFYLVGNSDSLLQTKLAALGLGAGIGLVTANVFTAAFDVVPADTWASSVGFLNVFAALGGGFGPFIAGILKAKFGLGNIMTAAGAVYALAGLALLLGTKLWFRRDYDRVHG